MNKTQLVEAAAAKSTLNKHEISHALDAILNAIIHAVHTGDTVALAGFGTFEKKDRPARTARNPRTGEPVDVAATSAPKFKAASAFKTAVNG